MIQPAADRAGLRCDEHPDLVLDEIGAAEHLRTVHSPYWQDLLRWRVESARARPAPDPKPATPAWRRPRHKKPTKRHR